MIARLTGVRFFTGCVDTRADFVDGAFFADFVVCALFAGFLAPDFFASGFLARGFVALWLVRRVGTRRA
jgi:hypothetical protein